MKIEEYIPIVESNLKHDKRLEPVAIIQMANEQQIIIPLFDAFESHETKRKFVYALSQFLKTEKAVKAIIITEVWKWIIPKDKAHLIDNLLENEEYKKLLERQEAYMVTEITRDSMIAISCDFTRENNEIIFGERTNFKDFESDLFNPIQKVLLRNH